jgi:pyridoxine 4-dehydrogenase
MRTALEGGANLWNGGQIYGTATQNSLQLLNEYFTKYPEDADKVVLSIKGGFDKGGLLDGGHPDGSPENIRKSINGCLDVLDGKKFLDLFECARVDPRVPVEQQIEAIDEFVKAGKLGGISLSEVGEKTIRQAAKVAKISAVEVEFSLFSTDILTNGVAKACAELDIPIIAYSPIGRGFLTGELKKPEDLPENDMRRKFPRFQGENFYNNLKLVDEIKKIAEKKGATAGQIAIAWVKDFSHQPGMPTIIPIPGASSDKRVLENSKQIDLTKDEMDEIWKIISSFNVSGDRYYAEGMKHIEG